MDRAARSCRAASGRAQGLRLPESPAQLRLLPSSVRGKAELCPGPWGEAGGSFPESWDPPRRRDAVHRGFPSTGSTASSRGWDISPRISWVQRPLIWVSKSWLSQESCLHTRKLCAPPSSAARDHHSLRVNPWDECLPEAKDSPGWWLEAGGLDWVTHRGPFQPRTFCDSVERSVSCRWPWCTSVPASVISPLPGETRPDSGSVLPSCPANLPQPGPRGVGCRWGAEGRELCLREVYLLSDPERPAAGRWFLPRHEPAGVPARFCSRKLFFLA